MDELKWSRDERPGALSLLLFSLLMWLLTIIQVGFFNRLPLLGAPAELVLVVTCYLGWRRGAVVGCVSGLVGGVVLDALGAPLLGLSLCPLLFVGAAIYTAWLSKRLFDRLPVYLIVLLPPLFILGVLRALDAHRVRVAFGVLLGGLLCALVVYAPLLWRRMRSRR